MKAVEAIIDPNGSIRLIEPLQVSTPTRALVTLLDPVEADVDAALLSQASLSEDWSRLEEDEAWAHLQPGESS